MKLSIAYITCPKKTEAKEIALYLISEGLAACVNIIDGIESYFAWGDEIQKASEHIIIAKTREKNEDKIIKLVKKLHSYENPAIIFLPIEYGNKEYLSWIEQNS